MTTKPPSHKAAQTLNTLLKTIQRIDQDFPLQYMICLNEISQNQGLSLSELAANTNMPLSTVSRIVGALSEKRQRGKAFGLVSVEICSQERRRKKLSLTSDGQKTVKNIHEILE